jgi:hypothetical protein
MLAEVFYKFLMMIKKIKKDIKFIISGDFCQLKPVNYRIPYNTDYAIHHVYLNKQIIIKSS